MHTPETRNQLLQFYIRMFEAHIDAQLNWSKIKAINCQVSVETLDIPSEAKRICLPWYLDQDNNFVLYTAIGARPLLLSDVESWYQDIPEDKKDKIERFRKDFETRRSEFSFFPAAYSVNAGHLLILDSCHRLTGAMRSGIPTSLTIWALQGPIDREILPDLPIVNDYIESQ
jgi:hypothetical protein